MELKIKLVSHYPSEVEDYTLIYEKLISTDSWLEQVESTHKAFFPYASYSVLDHKNDDVHILPYDDTYGKVEFNIYVADLTVEQLANHYTQEDGFIHIFAVAGGRGGDKTFIAFVELVKIIYENIGVFVSNNPIIYDLGKYATILALSKGKEFIKSGKLKHLEADTFLEYLYSKDSWTLEKLEIAFDYKNSKNIIALMNLIGYEMSNQGIFYKVEEEILLLESMATIPLKDQFKILIYYLEFKIYYNDSSIAGKNHLINELSRPINVEKLDSIIYELDHVFEEKKIRSYGEEWVEEI